MNYLKRENELLRLRSKVFKNLFNLKSRELKDLENKGRPLSEYEPMKSENLEYFYQQQHSKLKRIDLELENIQLKRKLQNVK
jgi:hypothetical protein